MLTYQSVPENELFLNYTTLASCATISQILELIECNKTSSLYTIPGFRHQNLVKELNLALLRLLEQEPCLRII